MIDIIRATKEEVCELRARFPDMQVVRTCRQKSKRHVYYVVETKAVNALLARMRGGKV